MSDSVRWTGECDHGNLKGRCMTCRAERAEAQLAAQEEEIARLKEELETRVDVERRAAGPAGSTASGNEVVPVCEAPESCNWFDVSSWCRACRAHIRAAVKEQAGH